jgi:glucosamine kinase
MTFKIGVDGGGSKTECILVDENGKVVASRTTVGCNPSIVGPAHARSIVSTALHALRSQVPGTPNPRVSATLLCMAGSTMFWQEFGAALTDCGKVTATDDSLPVLELATHGEPGIVLHAGTGSFVAARGPDGAIHYAGGLGWRFGDEGSGYDIGRRAIGCALLDLQGWAPNPRLSALVREQTGLPDAAAIIRFFYGEPTPNQKIASLAAGVLQLASEGDQNCVRMVVESTTELLDLGVHVAKKLFPSSPLSAVRTGLSGPILNHAVVVDALRAHSPLTLTAIEGAPIEGVRRMLLRG